MDISIDFSAVLNALAIKFQKKFICLFRGHHYSPIKEINSSIINATNYPDMQELLYAADVLITDYSSSMWDFSLTHKPGFLYAPDLPAYKNDRNFYTPIEEWPFLLAETNETLCGNIINFSTEKYIEDVKNHHKSFGSYENGASCKAVAELISSLIFK
jgi:CDP-glycerol glycerophosphotransferase